MKTANKIFIVLCLFQAFSGWSQRKFYYSGMVFQEFDMFSRNMPLGVGSFLKMRSFTLQADYRHNFSQVTEFQMLPPRDSYGLKLGLMRKSLGFSVGVQQIETYKKLRFEVHEEPVDINGDRLEDLYDVQCPLAMNQFSLGINILTILQGGKNMELMMDDFDMKLNKNKKRYQTILLAFELLYAPKLDYSTSFSYSPYGAYIPRDLYFAVPLKEKHFGFKMRLEYTSPAKIGIIADMGVFPGVAHKTNSYNDFNFGFKYGVLINMSVFDKSEL